MNGRKLAAFCASFALGILCTWIAMAAPAVTADEWSAYKQKFLDPSGRIIDNANGDISHSEGQGYGLLLSYLAGNRGDFDRIWSFTRTQLLVRDDGLAAWKWDPAADPHITDTNNATDGDLLIAYAAGMAGSSWSRPDLSAAARSMAQALVEDGLEQVGGMVMLKPGTVGFGRRDRPDGPVVNPSYWVFEAFPTMQEVAPDPRWQTLSDSGRLLIETTTRIGEAGLPPDWVSLQAQPTVASDMPQQFGYNALRVPLYLMRAGVRDEVLLRKLLNRMSDDSGKVRLVDILTGQTRELVGDPGYRIIPALMRCVLDGTSLPEDLRSFQPTDYYPSTLHLLGLSMARKRHPECM